MTLAKRTFYLSSALLLAGAMGLAQTAMGGSSQHQESSMAGQAAGAKLRGCLSGSAGNYTLTDHNGAIYHLVGGEAQLQDAVGHEVEVTGTPDARRTGATDDSASNTESSFQVAGAREVGARCDHGAASGTMDNNSRPMTERPPSTDHQPKGAPGEGVPPPESEPHVELMAALQQPTSTDTGTAMSQSSDSSTTMRSSSASTGQTSQSVGTTSNGAAGAPPPVTSQTPAAPQSPTDPNAQLGTGTASQTGVSTAAGTGASSGTATPETGTNAGSTSATTGATANSNTTASPQTPPDDANKPLYERQATDIPWASHSGSTTTTTTTNPNGSSTTTTTTTSPNPQR